MKLISVIVPCYNAEPFIHRCIDSLLDQTIGFENIELILVNDASSDNTLHYLLEYEEKYPNNIIVINLEENMKQGGARNIGLQYSSSEYIGFVDADDWIEPTMYEKLYNKIVETECELVSCNYFRDLDNTPYSMKPIKNSGKCIDIKNEEDRKILLIDGIPGGIWSKLYKKDLFVNNNITFPINLAYEDNYFVSMYSLYLTKYYIIDECLYHYYVNMNSTILSQNSINHFDRLKIELLKFDEFMNRGVFDKYYYEIEYSFLKTFYMNTLHTFFLRFDKVPYNIYLYMNNIVKVKFPNYQENPYIKEKEKTWLSFIEQVLTPLQIEEIANIYRSSLDK